MSEAEKAARLCTDLDRCSVAVEYDLSKSIAEKMHEATAFIRRLVAEKAKLAEAARPFAYVNKGEFYPTKREVERLRAAIEEVTRE